MQQIETLHLEEGCQYPTIAIDWFLVKSDWARKRSMNRHSPRMMSCLVACVTKHVGLALIPPPPSFSNNCRRLVVTSSKREYLKDGQQKGGEAISVLGPPGSYVPVTSSRKGGGVEFRHLVGTPDQ